MFVRYEVKWNFDGKFIVSKGFCQGEDFADIMRKIEEDYDEIEAVSMKWIEGYNTLSDETITEALEEEERQSGAGHQVFEAIQQGVQEAIEYEKLKANDKA